MRVHQLFPNEILNVLFDVRIIRRDRIIDLVQDLLIQHKIYMSQYQNESLSCRVFKLYSIHMVYLYVLIAFVVILALLFYIANKDPAPVAQSRPILAPMKRDLPLSELCKYDGKQDPRILVALKNVIYDVSSSDFYSPGGSYSVFAGHDASINLAKMSHDVEFLDKWEKYSLT